MENNKHLTDGFINKLKGFATKLEQVQLDVSLGKAEAKDKWNEYSKDFKHFLHESKMDFQNGTGVIGGLKSKAEELEVQFNLGKAEVKEYVEEHKKTLFRTINEIDKMIENKLS